MVNIIRKKDLILVMGGLDFKELWQNKVNMSWN
jgi:hypothetical protein